MLKANAVRHIGGGPHINKGRSYLNAILGASNSTFVQRLFPSKKSKGDGQPRTSSASNGMVAATVSSRDRHCDLAFPKLNPQQLIIKTLIVNRKSLNNSRSTKRSMWFALRTDKVMNSSNHGGFKSLPD